MADNQLVPQPEVPGASFGPALGGFAAGPFKNFVIGALRDFGDPIHKMAFPESPSEFVQGLGGTMLGMAAPMGAKGAKSLAETGLKAYKEALGLPAEPLAGKLYGTKDIGFSPGGAPDYQHVIAGGKKIGEITSPETSAYPHLLWMYHWEGDAPAREFSGMAAAKQAALKSATGIEKEPTYKGSLSESDITKALAKNPGASIFDIAGIKDKTEDVLEAIGAPVSKLINEGKYQYRKLTGTELQSPPVPQWGEKGFPWPQGEFAERAKQGGFTTPAWSGQNRYKFTEFTKENPGGVVPEEVPQQIPFRGGKTYMSSSPKLADMYGSSMETHPDTEVYFSRNAVNVPLLLNTDKFHKVDAKGRIWTEVNERAIDEARRKNAPGVTVKNVYDEPNPPFNRALGHPTDVHIVFEGAGTARSPFAKFDPSKFNTNDLLAGLGGGAISAPLLMGDSGAQR